MPDIKPGAESASPTAWVRVVLHATLMMTMVLGMLPATALMSAAPATAAFAPGGSGLYKGTIDWMEWGTRDAAVTAPTTKSSTREIDGQKLVTTCTIDTVSGQLKAYRSGSWKNDALDDLYNKGGTGSSNELVYGLANSVDGRQVDFHVSCSASLGGSPVPLGGLVVADAEASGNAEFISATPDAPKAGQPEVKWRIIERFRAAGCSTHVNATLAVNKKLTLQPNAAECANGGPMAIGYMDGATGATVSVKGAGTSAVALGVVLESDFGDAPLSYGSAGSLFERSWTGGLLTTGSTNVSDNTFVLGTPDQPKTRLGAQTDSDIGYQASADASADDLTRFDDEDAILPLGTLSVYAGQKYTLPSVMCTGPGYVAGWIDWNVNGKFDPGERSAAVQCTGSSVALPWTVPADVTNTPGTSLSFLRLRIAQNEAGVAQPTGMTTSGEVEDHPLRLSVPTLSIEKNVAARVAPTDQFTLSLRNGSNEPLNTTTSGNSTGIQGARIGPISVGPGSQFNFQESIANGSPSPLNEYDSQYTCTATYRDQSTSVLKAESKAQGSITIPVLDAAKGAPAIACVFDNKPKSASLQVTKKWIVNGTTYINGNQPKGLEAQLTLQQDSATTNQDWGATKAGYAAGDKVSLAETTTIAPQMPGCRIDGAKLTGANGSTTDTALPAEQTLRAGANTAEITNTVTCKSTLTLNKDVRSGGKATPADWTLHAYPGSGPATFDGPTGVKGEVVPGATLQLAESGNPLYVQDDERTEPERSLSPRATGSWTCNALDASGGTINNVLSARTGLNGTIVPALGSHTSCTAVNRTARVSILKFVENLEGTGTGSATPADWELSAVPHKGVDGLEAATVTGSMKVSEESTIQVRPGHGYDLSEDGTLGGYFQVALQRFTGTDSSDTTALANAANWEAVDSKDPVMLRAGEYRVYRFVNREAAAFELPLTGGGGTLPYVLVGGLVIFLTLGAGALYKRRSKNKNQH